MVIYLGGSAAAACPRVRSEMRTGRRGTATQKQHNSWLILHMYSSTVPVLCSFVEPEPPGAALFGWSQNHGKKGQLRLQLQPWQT